MDRRLSLFLRPAADHGFLERIGLTGVSIALSIGAGVGMAFAAGIDDVLTRLQHPHWPWLLASLGFVTLGFIAYAIAYRGVHSAGCGSHAHGRSLMSLAIMGFGPFLPRGGAGLDREALRAAGATDRDARVRLTAAGGLELVLLAAAATVTAIVLLVQHVVVPHADFTWPWAIAAPAGFLLGFWATRRFRERLRHHHGLAGMLGTLLDGAHLVFELLRRPTVAVWAMAVYWAAEMAGVWAAMAAFGFQMALGGLILGFASGYVVTRRTAPFGGAGMLMAALAAALWLCGAPLPAAVLGVFAYQFFSLWLPLPVALHWLRHFEDAALRGMGPAPPRKVKPAG
jgi:uncharacterized membrane protein YbhN (UPF0104 family)